MPDVLVYSTCNQFARGVFDNSSGARKISPKLNRRRIVPASRKSGGTAAFIFANALRTTRSTYRRWIGFSSRRCQGNRWRRKIMFVAISQQRKLRRAAGHTRLRCSAEFLLCLKSHGIQSEVVGNNDLNETCSDDGSRLSPSSSSSSSTSSVLSASA